MTINKWHVHIASLLILFGAPSLFGQDFLKQLEAKLFQKQQDSKAKEQSSKVPAKEPNREPLELPSVLEPENPPAPGLLKPLDEPETFELPAPKKEPKSPPTRKATKPESTKQESANDDSSTAKAMSPTPSPFRANPSKTVQKTPTLSGGGGFLGLTVESVPGGGFGLTVVEVAADSPAWKSGFRNGDKVIGVDGQAVSTVDAFAEQLSRFAPGSPVRFLVDRRGKTANLVSVLQDRAVAGQIHGIRPGTALELEPSSNQAGRPGVAYFGVNVSDMSDAYRRQFGIPAYRGASVTEVVPNSPAHSAGLKPGDCIVEIEGATVQSAELVFDTISRAKPGQLISFSYYRGRQLNNASVQLVSNGDGPNNGSAAAISREMLTPEYVANLQAELDRVHGVLSETQARVQQLEAKLQRLESKR